MSGDVFRAHTGRRKRKITAGEVESFSKRRAGSAKERETAARMFAPTAKRCPHCFVLTALPLPVDAEGRSLPCLVCDA